jgi:hypothetical protein
MLKTITSDCPLETKYWFCKKATLSACLALSTLVLQKGYAVSLSGSVYLGYSKGYAVSLSGSVCLDYAIGYAVSLSGSVYLGYAKGYAVSLSGSVLTLCLVGQTQFS